MSVIPIENKSNCVIVSNGHKPNCVVEIPKSLIVKEIYLLDFKNLLINEFKTNKDLDYQLTIFIKNNFKTIGHKYLDIVFEDEFFNNIYNSASKNDVLNYGKSKNDASKIEQQKVLNDFEFKANCHDITEFIMNYNKFGNKELNNNVEGFKKLLSYNFGEFQSIIHNNLFKDCILFSKYDDETNTYKLYINISKKNFYKYNPQPKNKNKCNIL